MINTELTPKEQSIVNLIKRHPEYTNAQLAEHFKLSSNTIRELLRRVYDKAGIEGGRGVNKRMLLLLKLQEQDPQ